MAAEWVETTLGGVADFLSGGTPSKDRADYWGGSIPWVSAKDMKRFRLEDTEDHLTSDGAENGTKVVPPGTVLLLTRGMTLLNDVPICVAGQPMAFNQDVKALRPKPGIRNEFLPYLLLGHKERLLASVDLAGHGTGRLNSDELKHLDVQVPPEPEQRAIAHILGTLDDKIELNRRIGETLDAMARALFQSWFVDFDPVRAKATARETGLPIAITNLFPDRLEAGEVGDLPMGWAVTRFGDAVEVLRDQENPLDSPSQLFSHHSIPAFDDARRPVREYGQAIMSLKFRVPPGVILLSKLNPEIERVWMVDVRPDERAICSTEFLVLRGRAQFTRAYIYCLARSPAFRQHLESLVTGTSKSHQRAQGHSVLNLRIVLPPDPVVEAFDRIVADLFARVLGCRREIEVLAAMRNTLLPKLISGELRIAGASRLLEE